MGGHQSVIAVTERSQIGEARREAARLCELAGFSDVESGNASIVVSELATNLARHARDGRLSLHLEWTAWRTSLVMVSIDRGPGMADVPSCLQDGYSTGGTPGNGFGAIQRLSRVFDLYSTAPAGTVIYSRIDRDAPGVANESVASWCALSVPIASETICGDSWRIADGGRDVSVLIADGLGHGSDASEAAEIAGEVFDSDPFALPQRVVEGSHERMRGSRGGALAVARMDASNGSLKYAGVGNISGAIRTGLDGMGRGLFSHNGTVGVQVRKVQEFDYEFPYGALLIMFSDGLQSRWSLEAYPGLAQRHPGVIAGVLLRDFTRGRDDVTVAVVRRGPEARVYGLG